MQRADSSTSHAKVGIRQIYALLIVSLIYCAHTIDRLVVNVLVEPIKHEFALSDGAAGLMTGVVSGIAFLGAALPLGWLADRVSRRNLLGAVCFGWSLLTITSGMVGSYGALLLSRIGVTALEAGAAPCSLSLLADTFRREQRATAFGVFYMSTAVGAAICFAAGGYIAGLYGWRWVFIAAGLPGVLLAALLLLTVPEPPRGNTDQLARPGMLTTLRLLLGHPVAARLLSASGVATLVHSALWAWMVSFLVRSHGMKLAYAAAIMAVVAGISTAIGSGVLGALADRVAAGQPLRGLRVPAATTLISIPLGLAALYAPSPMQAVALLVVLGFFIGAWPAPAFSAIAEIAPPDSAAMSMAIGQIVTNVAGVAVGAPLVGLLSDSFGGTHGLRTALAIVLLANLVASALFYSASRTGSYLQAKRTD